MSQLGKASFLPVLTFHSIDDVPSATSFSPQLFQRGMAQLYESGYRTLNFPELAGCLQRGDAFPEYAFAISFDDGYQSVYEQAFPILQRYGFSATVFLTVGKKRNGSDSERLPPIYDRTMLSWGEIREMQRFGIDFGAHTVTHPDLTLLPLKLAENEICDSKAVIEDILNGPVSSFAYPYGRYDERCRDIVSRHFLCACSDKLGLVRSSSDRYTVERVDAYYLQNETLIGSLFAGWFPYYVWARAIPRQLRRVITGYVANKCHW